MIFLVFVLICLLEQLSSLPAGKSWNEDSIVFQDDRPWDGRSYSFGFGTLFGTYRKEKAELKENALGIKYLDVEGEYSYPMADGSLRKVSYRSNDQGYKETEAHGSKIAVKGSFSNNLNIIENSNKLEDKIILKTKQDGKSNVKNKLDNDRIFFPTERDEEPTSTTTPASILTTMSPPSSTNSTNLTESIDYYYDELGNRVGGVPPAVLGSLLG